jgi:glycosyltransferase involved in cell wall biosynthesis
LEKNISFLGLVPHKEVFNYMNNAHVFLHTSNYEGNSTVLMEALYSGCSVISKQSLRKSNIDNLIIKTKKDELIQSVLEILNQKREAQQIVFNTMDDSVKKIINLFLV